MMLFPLITLVFSILVNYYLYVVYRRVIPEINEHNYIDYQDLETPNQSVAFNNFQNYPLYIEKILDGNGKTNTAVNNSNILNNISVNTSYTFTKHFNGRTESLFEENIFLGKSGFAFFSNFIQFLNVIIITWFTGMVCKYLPEYIVEDKIFFFAIFFILSGFYFTILFYLTNKSLRILTILRSTEMNKQEEEIKQTIYYQTERSASIASKLIRTFRKIYFDIMRNSKDKNFNVLSKPAYKLLIDLNMVRFNMLDATVKDPSLVNEFTDTITIGDQQAPDVSKEEINVAREIKLFSKSCGNNLSNEDVENMLHYIDNIEDLRNNETLSKRDIYDIWGTNMFFSKENPQNIMLEVFMSFNKEIEYQDEANGDFGCDLLKRFFEFYKDYFTKEEIEFAVKEGSMLKNNFSKEVFIQMVCSLSRYHQY